MLGEIPLPWTWPSGRGRILRLSSLTLSVGCITPLQDVKGMKEEPTARPKVREIESRIYGYGFRAVAADLGTSVVCVCGLVATVTNGSFR